jgi:GNAT superfamily N-acetyltransferase
VALSLYGAVMRRDDPFLRRGGERDALKAAELWLRSRRTSIPVNPPPVHTDAEVREWFATRVMRECETWLAVAGDPASIVALLVLDGGWVDQLHVEPAWTGRGIGSRLIELAQRQRPGGLELWTFQANQGARRFYERHGFEAIELTDGSGNEERTPDVRYAWRGPGK